MVLVNGNEFENYDQAIAFMQEEKRRSEENEKRSAINTFLDKTMNAIVVEQDNKHYIFCTLSEDENRRFFPRAVVEEALGNQYEIIHNRLIEKYQCATSSFSTSTSLGKVLKEHIAKNYTRKSMLELPKLSYNETEYIVYIFDFTEGKSKSPQNTEGDKKQNLKNLEDLLNMLFC